MNKFWLMLVFLLAVVAPPGNAFSAGAPVTVKPGVLSLISDFASPPFTYLDAGTRKGFEVELGEALAREMGRRVEWVQMPFNIPTYRSALAAGRADAIISSLSITPARQKYFAFTRPYFIAHQAAAILKKFQDQFENLDRRLTGAVIGVMRGTTGEQWVRENLSPLRTKTYNTPERLARALKNGEVMVAVMDQAILSALLARNHYKFEIPLKDLDVENYGIAVRLRKKKLLDNLNAALERLDQKGI